MHIEPIPPYPVVSCVNESFFRRPSLLPLMDLWSKWNFPNLRRELLAIEHTVRHVSSLPENFMPCLYRRDGPIRGPARALFSLTEFRTSHYPGRIDRLI